MGRVQKRIFGADLGLGRGNICFVNILFEPFQTGRTDNYLNL